MAQVIRPAILNTFSPPVRRGLLDFIQGISRSCFSTSSFFSCFFSPPSSSPALHRSGHRRTSTWHALYDDGRPDLNREAPDLNRETRVGSAGPQPWTSRSDITLMNISAQVAFTRSCLVINESRSTGPDYHLNYPRLHTSSIAVYWWQIFVKAFCMCHTCVYLF